MRNPLSNAAASTVTLAVKRGPVVTLFFSCLLAGLAVYFGYGLLVSPLAEANRETEQAIQKLEEENAKNREIERTEPEFRAEVAKMVALFETAQPLLPSNAEVGRVLAEVQSSAVKHGATLTGLNSLKPQVKSPGSDKLYEREYPAVVTGTHAQVMRFFSAVSHDISRIVVIRDFTETSLRDRVSMSFTLMAYNTPPQEEMPKLAAGLPSLAVPQPANQPQEAQK